MNKSFFFVYIGMQQKRVGFELIYIYHRDAGARIRTRPKGMDNLCLFSAECVREVVAMWLYDFYYIVSVCIYRYSEIRNNKELDSTHSS